MMDPITCLKIIDSLMNNEAETASELAVLLQLPIKTVMGVLAHPDFTKRFHKIKKSVAKTEFDTVAYDRLIDIIRKKEEFDLSGKSGTDKNAIAAAKALADILGMTEKKAGTQVNVNLSFDSIIREAQQKGTEDEIVFPGFED